MNLTETLNKVSALREAAKAQIAEGKTPEVSLQAIDLMEKMASQELRN